jgi:hypothetical protein
MTYREVQRSNTTRRNKLPKADRVWLQEHGYRNVGWDNVITLYQKINDFLTSPGDGEEPTLEELFLRADHIGKKYQTPEEVQAYEQALQAEVEAIAAQIDRQFPDDQVEVVDYGSLAQTRRRPAKSRKK